ncbi:SAM-dependent methyltransferase [Mycobacteroides abscessus]|uniref:S-adenosyl-L-methionine-dependent methyltransferase n=1 Tax=Mycobacteroides abscessus TaxID=36809 RepID=A0A0U0ZHK6_9MYCO|nr:SAM-dependent methyltransferase [Mycobacteroides abscessus]SKV21814.1 S-adenosyl-L-methionine-dependent methyltransferase [Mycobacteroides abscessus subsp. abscessus]MBL3734483.1 SAM-dependent methyltransferase [Mycobacteroides abscessus subsp. massiliense]MBL3744167.1 SAM-dependent methyltransferase [Mycobacteroides abscessus subsp. massiliense]MBL3759735.1 SAM-dependent methyltransferase [Mycobacteroides abscessus subsp. massiliense]MBN7480126.1 SAM-dependent methyltransferase [Mycobacter
MPQSNPAAQTAFGPMAITAVEQHEPAAARIVDDDLAALILPRGVRWFVRATAWAPLRHWLIRLTERGGQGVWSLFVCRKRYIDDQLAASSIDAVVDLGAGLDTRGCRLARAAPTPVFEVDQAVNIAIKQQSIKRALGTVPASLHLVPVDFQRDELAEELRRAGHDTAHRTFFIWEGVTQYIPETAVRATLAYLGTAATGSRLAFTYVQRDFIDGSNLYGNSMLYKRFRVRSQVWMFGLTPGAVAPLLAEYGWQVLEDVSGPEYQRRYLIPAGRTLSTTELERTVLAEKI